MVFKQISYDDICGFIRTIGGEVTTTAEKFEESQKELNTILSLVPINIKIATCGHEILSKYKYCKREGRIKCMDCRNVERSYTYDQIKSFFLEWGGTLLTTETEYLEKMKQTKPSRIFYDVEVTSCHHLTNIMFTFAQQHQSVECKICSNLSEPNKMNYSAYNIDEIIKSKDCQLITPRHDLEQQILLKSMNTSNMKLSVRMTCGHLRTIDMAEFCRLSLYECIACVRQKSDDRMKIINGVNLQGFTNPNYVEYQVFLWLCKILEPSMKIVRTSESNKADFLYRPSDVSIDSWAKVQIKSATAPHRDGSYSFDFKDHYSGMMMILACISTKKIWCIEADSVDVKKFHIHDSDRSRYQKFLCDDQQLTNRLINFYNSAKLYEIHEAMNDVSADVLIAQKYARLRVESIPFLSFLNFPVENQITDFLIESIKFQEKSSERDLRYGQVPYYSFTLTTTKSQKKSPYSLGDNDFYWFNLGESKKFYVIPEKILEINGYLKTDDVSGKGSICLSPEKRSRVNNSDFALDYMFDYDEVDKDRLIQLLGRHN